MKNYLIAERYAGALSGVIESDAEAEAAAASLEDFRRLYVGNHELYNVLTNPAMNMNKIQAVLSAVLAKLGASDTVCHFLKVLAQRGRITLLEDVCEVFQEKVDLRVGRTYASVTTAMPVTDAQKAALREKLQALTGKTVRMTMTIDKEILGGAITRIEGKIIDGSLKTRLERLKTALISEES